MEVYAGQLPFINQLLYLFKKMKIVKGKKEYFKVIKAIKYEGPDSDNPLAFKFYNPKRKVGKKTMEEHLRFAIAYWHTFCGTGGDPFGPGTKMFAWNKSDDAMQRAYDKMDAAFEFITKIGAPFIASTITI